jgi:hypothetical protein
MAKRARRNGTTPPGIVCGRKFCPECGKWRHVCFFPIYGTTTSKSGELRIQGACENCVAPRSRRYRKAMKRDRRKYRAHLERERERNEARRRSMGVPQRNWTATGHGAGPSRPQELGAWPKPTDPAERYDYTEGACGDHFC